MYGRGRPEEIAEGLKDGGEVNEENDDEFGG
jgi:hypothetical protein